MLMRIGLLYPKEGGAKITCPNRTGYYIFRAIARPIMASAKSSGSLGSAFRDDAVTGDVRYFVCIGLCAET
jgi:hypothetical protein